MTCPTRVPSPRTADRPNGGDRVTPASPLRSRDWPPEMIDALTGIDPAGRRHAHARPGNRRGRNALGLFAHHPHLAKAFMAFNGHVLWDTTLSPRQRHLLILRTAAKRRASYVWTEHVAFAREVGLSPDEIERAGLGAGRPGWAPLESALLAAVDDLIDDGCLSDPTMRVLNAELDVTQIIDVIFTVVCYEATSWFFTSFRLPIEPDDAGAEAQA